MGQGEREPRCECARHSLPVLRHPRSSLLPPRAHPTHSRPITVNHTPKLYSPQPSTPHTCAGVRAPAPTLGPLSPPLPSPARSPSRAARAPREPPLPPPPPHAWHPHLLHLARAQQARRTRAAPPRRAALQAQGRALATPPRQLRLQQSLPCAPLHSRARPRTRVAPPGPRRWAAVRGWRARPAPRRPRWTAVGPGVQMRPRPRPCREPRALGRRRLTGPAGVRWAGAGGAERLRETVERAGRSSGAVRHARAREKRGMGAGGAQALRERKRRASDDRKRPLVSLLHR